MSDTPTPATDEDDGLLRFLKSGRSLDDLRTALAVIEEFKANENAAEFMDYFVKWVRLEQLEDYLRLLTGQGAERVQDERAIAYLAAVRGS